MTVEMRDITGIKRVADKLYAIIDNGEKQVIDYSLSDKRDTVVSYKTVSDFSLMEINKAQAKQYIDIAKEWGVLPEELPSNSETIWVLNFTATINELEILQVENATLKAQLATLQEAHDTTVTHMAQENARLQEEMEAWVAMSVSPADYFEELQVRDDEILTLKAKLMLSKAYIGEFAQVGVKKVPVTYEVYITPSFALKVTSRNGWHAIGHSKRFDTAVDVMKWYIEAYMNGEIPQWMIGNG